MMTVIRELAAIVALSRLRWRRDVVLSAGSVLVMVCALWIPFGR